MAEKIKIAELDIDSKGLVDSMVKTKESIQAVSDANKVLKISGKELSDTYVKNEAELKTLNGEYAAQRKVLQAVTDAEKKYNTELNKENKTVDAAVKNNKALKQIRNQINTSTKEGAAQVAKINAKIDENTKFIKTNSSAQEKQYQNVGNYSSALEGIFPQMRLFNGALAKGRNLLNLFTGQQKAATAATAAASATTTGFSGALKVLKFALIATGIGAIVVVLGSLVGMLANTQKGTDFVSKSMQALGAAFAVITDRISQVGGAFAKFFAGDFEGGFNDLQEALKGVGDEIAAEAGQAYDLAAALQAVEDKEISLITTKSKRLKQLAELRLLAKEENRSLTERADLLAQAGELEKANLADALAIAKEKARISQAQTDLGESTRDEIRANAELQAKVDELETASLNLQRSIVAEREGLLKRNRLAVQADQKQAVADLEITDTEEENIKNESALEDIKREEEKLKTLRALRDEFILNEEQLRTAEIDRKAEAHLVELETLGLHEAEKAELEKAIIADKEAAIALIKSEHIKEEIAGEDNLQKERLAARKGTVDGIIALTQAETGIGKAALIAKQLLAIKENAINLGLFKSKASMALSESIVDTAKGVTKSAAAAPFPANLPLIAGFIASVAGVGSTIKNAITGQKSDAKFAEGGILSGASHSRGGIPTPFGELEGGEAVINKRSTALFRPILSRLNEAGGGKKFATGGILGDAANNSSQSFFDYDMLASKITQGVSALPNPVVGVNEIVDVANRVDVIETAGDF